MSPDSMLEKPDSMLEKTVVERFLDRYIVVWIWSIVFGAGTGLFYSATEIQIGNWGLLTALLMVPAAATLLAALASWVHLYHGLTVYILPLLLSSEFSPTPEARKKLAYHLRRSFFFVLWTGVFRGVTAIFQVLLSSSSRLG